MGFPDSSIGKEPSCNAGDPSSIPEFGKICWKRERLHMPVFLGFPCVSAGKEFFNGETWTQWSFSFSISPFSDYSGLISFRTDWFDPLAIQDSQESSPASQFESISSFALNILNGPTVISIHDY